jgi:hypothetical protein
MLTSIFGIVVVLKQMSANDKLERKKYMGVWRCVSELTAMTMSRFPKMVTMYINRKRLNMNDSCAGSSDSPSRKNCEKPVLFLASMLLVNLMEI